jgi:putative endonuclease
VAISARIKERSGMGKLFAVYILTNKSHKVLYTGITNDLIRRVYEHKEHKIPEFTKKYHVDKLVYYETHDDPSLAIEREKKIKAGSRLKKIMLINALNPDWKDLYDSLVKG